MLLRVIRAAQILVKGEGESAANRPHHNNTAEKHVNRARKTQNWNPVV